MRMNKLRDSLVKTSSQVESLEKIIYVKWQFPPTFSLKTWRKPGAKEKTTYKINCKWLIFTVGPDGLEPSTP